MKRMMVFLLCISIVMVAHAAPSRNQYAACKQGAKDYAHVAVFFSDTVNKMTQSTKPNTKNRNEWIQAIKNVKEELEVKEFDKLRQVEAEIVRRGEDYQSAVEWRVWMESTWLIAFNLGVSRPGKSELYYKNAIEDQCLSGKV